MKARELWVAFLTMLRKEVIRILRIWPQSLLPPTITMTLYFMIFGKLIGSQIAPIKGFTYIQYLVPGLIMMAVITNSYMNTVSSLYLSRFQKNIEEVLVSPIPHWLFLLGVVSGGVVRGCLVGLIVSLISLFFADLSVVHWGLTLSIVVLTSLLFSLAGFVNAIYAKSFDDISFIPTFVLTPLTYLGGVFYSLEFLSPTFRSLSLLNPILYMVNAFRFGFLGLSDIPVGISFLIVGGAVLFFFFFCLHLLRRGIGFKE